MLTKQRESHPTSSYIFFRKCLYFKQELENPRCLSENDHWAELKLSAKVKNTLVNTVVRGIQSNLSCFWATCYESVLSCQSLALIRQSLESVETITGHHKVDFHAWNQTNKFTRTFKKTKPLDSSLNIIDTKYLMSGPSRTQLFVFPCVLVFPPAGRTFRNHGKTNKIAALFVTCIYTFDAFFGLLRN